MKVVLAVATALLLLAIAVAATAPATLADARVSALSGGRLRIAAAAGTLWNGSGDLVMLPRGTRRAMAWHIDAWPLFVGELRGTLRTGGGEALPAEFSAGPASNTLRRFDLSLPMESLLQTAGVPGAIATAGGVVSAHVERLVQTPGAIEANLALQWQDATVPTLQPGLRIALGDVRCDVQGAGREIEGALSNRGGDVEIAGRVALTASLAPRIDATIRPRAGLDRDRTAAIASALSLVAAPDGHGGFRLAWSGS